MKGGTPLLGGGWGELRLGENYLGGKGEKSQYYNSLCAYSFDDPVPKIWCAGQCEYSFSKTHVIMEMSKKEMERYEEVYRYVFWKRVWTVGGVQVWITSVYYVIEYYGSVKSVGFRNMKAPGL